MLGLLNDFKKFCSDSAMVQSAVDKAAQSGETVTIPRINPRTGENVWIFDEAVQLYSGSTICLDNCVIKGSPDLFDNLFKNSNARTERASMQEGRQSNICIYGLGNAILDGGEPIPFGENTRKPDDPPVFAVSPIHFHNVSDFSIKNIKITNQRYWGIVCHYCTDGTIKEIRFDTEGKAPNQDGIDLRKGCQRIFIDDISGKTGDDLVALTALSGSEKAYSVEGMSGDICNVTITNLRGVTHYYKGLIRLLNHNGNKIHDIIIENVMDISDSPLPQHRFGSAVRIGENGYYGNGEPAKSGDTYNITVRNVVTSARVGVFISCTLYNSLIDNVRMRDFGGTAVLFRKGDYKDIDIANISYSHNCIHPKTDDNTIENEYNTKIGEPPIPENERKVCAVYSQGGSFEDVFIDKISVCGNLTSVFGGEGNGKITCRSLRINDNIPFGAIANTEVILQEKGV